MYMHSTKANNKRHKLKKTIPHRHWRSDSQLPQGLACAWTAKKKGSYHSSVGKKKKKSLAILFLPTDPLIIFCLLWVHLEVPKGDWGVMSKDPEEPWTEELTGT